MARKIQTLNFFDVLPANLKPIQIKFDDESKSDTESVQYYQKVAERIVELKVIGLIDDSMFETIYENFKNKIYQHASLSLVNK